ncbi:phosphatase PAP2 family protein [Psychroflexus halocasei]|uniref:Undecaprenyl-diphosphatase n=1 Tax=Psychroflexus halocasei TaxID=908615 RepID=A0A1H4C6G0_9FLAO|nr:phosphatase PAP2 family protein [Psychroflexus halocasei]SEA55949.1 undecaprenyl-diphosphatase [Psychroflexus halocasei]
MHTLVELDHQLFLYLNNLGSRTWDVFWVFITEKETSYPLYAVFLFLCYKHYGLKGLGTIMITVALMITVTDQLSNLFKDTIMRPRPCNEDFMMQARFVAKRCGDFGFFSGHAVSSFAVVFFIGNLLKNKVKYIFTYLLIWGFVIAYSRIYVGVHYPGDIIVGALFGTIIGTLFYKLNVWARKKLNLTKA